VSEGSALIAQSGTGVTLTPQDVFLVVDVQNCFVPGGTLPVKEGDQVGFTALVIEDACRGIDAGGSLAKAWTDMQGIGVQRIQSSAITR
jgi:nicotinamidase-related amidase